MTINRHLHRLTAIAVSGFAGAWPLCAAATTLSVENPSAFLIPEAEEIALSRSAGPASIASDAKVLTLSADGSYRTAVEGQNGWTCFTGRAWTGPAVTKDGKRQWTAGHLDPKSRAPQCFNKAAAESILEVHRLTTRMLMSGSSTDEVDRALGLGLTNGSIRMPEPGAMSYMYSPLQVLGRAGRFKPHLMLYTPYVEQEDYGASDAKAPVPIVTNGGTAFTVTVVMSTHWSDGTKVD